MRNRNKINLALWGVFLALFICTAAQAELSWDVNPIGYGANPQIHGKNIVWQSSGGDIFLYDALDSGTAVLISNGSYNNSNPQIYENYICWEGFDYDDDVYKIFLYDGMQRIALNLLDGTSPQAPQVSDKLVVWYASDGTNDEIYAYDIDDWSTDKLTNDDYDNQNPQVSGYNVTWEARKDAGTLSLFFYDALDNRKVMVREQLSVDNWHPQIYDDTIAWWGGVIYPAPDYYKLELFMFDESDDYEPVQITEYYAQTVLVYPQIWGKNIVWEGLNRSTIDFYDGITQEITHISNPCLLNKCPQVWDNKVVWEGITVDYNYEIYFWDGNTNTTYNLSTSSAHDQAPQIYNCDVVWHTDTGFVYLAEAVSTSNINVYPLSYDFGEVWVGSTSITTITISNVSSDMVALEYIDFQEGSSSDFSIESAPRRFPVLLGAGESLPVEIEFAPSFLGQASAILEIGTNDPNEEIIEVPLNGNGVAFPDIVVLPLTYDFEEVYVGTSAETIVAIFNMGNLFLEVQSIDFQPGSSSDFSIVSAPELPATLTDFGGRQNTEVEIAYSPSEIGPASAILEIRSDDPYENLVQVTLSAEAVSPDIEVVPTAYDFNEVLVDTNATTTVTISNQGEADLTISEVSLQLGRRSDFYVSTELNLPMDLAYGEFVDIDVVFIPSSEGLSTDILEICSNDPNDNIVQVQLSGTGIE